MGHQSGKGTPKRMNNTPPLRKHTKNFGPIFQNSKIQAQDFRLLCYSMLYEIKIDLHFISNFREDGEGLFQFLYFFYFLKAHNSKIRRFWRLELGLLY
jgi:hypothetical protein